MKGALNTSFTICIAFATKLSSWFLVDYLLLKCSMVTCFCAYVGMISFMTLAMFCCCCCYYYYVDALSTSHPLFMYYSYQKVYSLMFLSKDLIFLYQVQKHREYRQKIISSYQVFCVLTVWLSLNMLNRNKNAINIPLTTPILFFKGMEVHYCYFTCLQPLHRELYTMHPATTFVPSFLKAISDNTEESFRSIMSEPSPGVFTFEMLQPRFCELLLAEVLLTICP